MRRFMVNVNGTCYEIEVEEINGATPPANFTAAPTVAKAAAPTPAPVVSDSAETISAPMPGSILAVNCKVGDGFKRGQVLIVLEAMKMENEILAPRDGVVAAVYTSKGSTVNSGDALIAFN